MRKYLVLILGYMLVVQIVLGQSVDLRFVEFNHNSELSSTYLTAVEQDKLGFMWFGSTSGLQRYDGYSFQYYLTSEGQNFDIVEGHIFELFADSYGLLWITLNSNVCYYDYEVDSIKVVANESNSNGLDSYYVSCYSESEDSTLYVSTFNSIYRFNRDSLNFEEVFKVDDGEVSNFIIKENRIYAASMASSNLHVFDLVTKEYKVYNGPETLNIKKISDLEFHSGLLWLATDGEGIFSVNTSNGDYKQYPADSEYAKNVTELYVDKEGLLWAVDFTGLKMYVKEMDIFQGYYPEDNNEYSIAPHVKNIFQDKDLNYWTIHNPGGVGFSPRPRGFNRFDSNINSPFRLTVNNVSAVAEDLTGNLWMANPFNGIDVFYWSLGRTISYFHDENDPNSLGKGATQCITRDINGNMWVGSYWGGLQRFRPSTGDFVTYIHHETDSTSIAGNDIRDITVDKKGNLWVCVHGKGIDYFDTSTGEAVHYTFEANNLANDYTFESIIDKKGQLWVGTAWGLSVLKPGETQFKNYNHSGIDKLTLSSNVIQTLYEDEEGDIWVGTPKGLNKYDPDNDCFIRLEFGFTSKNISSVTSDKDGNIWVGTLLGLSRFNPMDSTVLNLTKDDGLNSNTFNLRSVFNNNENTLFYGTLDGLVYFDPLKIHFNENAPNVYLTDFKVLNSSMNLHNSNFFDKNLVVTDTIEIDYSQKIIEFELSALNYTSSERNNFAYYLDGFDKDWIASGNRRNIVYTNLDPGRYKFKYKASNNEGIWSEPSVITLIIKPPFWMTLWFKITAFVIVLVGLTLIIRNREMNLVRANIKLESKVNERTAEIYEQKEELELQKEELEKANDLKNKFFSILAHDLKSPVYSIVQLNKLFKENYPLEDEKAEKILNMSIQTAQNTYKLLEDLLIWGKTQTKNVIYDFEDVDLLRTVNHTIKNFDQIAKVKDINIVTAIPSKLRVYVDANTFKVVLRNLISNAIKFSYQNSKIEVSAVRKDKMVEISVKDTGVGMSEELQNDLFNSMVKTSYSGTSGEKGTGLGLILCRELVGKNGGEIWVKSQLKEGSAFYFTVPLSEDSQNV